MKIKEIIKNINEKQNECINSEIILIINELTANGKNAYKLSKI